MGYPWPADIKGGRLPYLCEEDSIELQNRIADAQRRLVPLSVPDVFEQAFLLKTQRIDSAVAFRLRANCQRLADDLLEKGVDEPSRS
jgi:hypothetical protein